MGNVVIAIGLDVPDIYGRISATPLTQIGNYSVGQLLIIMLMVVGALFLIIQAVAFSHGAVAGAFDHRSGPRARHRHRTRAARRFHASHHRQQRRSARRPRRSRSTR